MNEPQVEPGQRVTPLELFFDLVFVFAITQVTGFLAADPTWVGLLRGLMLLAALFPAVGLFSGLAMYLAAHHALRLRIGCGLGHGRRSPRSC